MPRDLKTGMVLGLIVAIVAVFWLSARSDLSVDMGFSQQVGPAYEFPPEPNDESIASEADDPIANNTQNPGPPQPSDSNVFDSTIYEQDHPIETERFHIVRKDQTLSDISRQYYGTPGKWRQIVRANRDVISDPDRIKPGTKLIIPR